MCCFAVGQIHWQKSFVLKHGCHAYDIIRHAVVLVCGRAPYLNLWRGFSPVQFNLFPYKLYAISESRIFCAVEDWHSSF